MFGLACGSPKQPVNEAVLKGGVEVLASELLVCQLRVFEKVNSCVSELLGQ